MAGDGEKSGLYTGVCGSVSFAAVRPACFKRRHTHISEYTNHNPFMNGIFGLGMCTRVCWRARTQAFIVGLTGPS